MKLDFIIKAYSKFTLPLAGLQHMLKCQVGWVFLVSFFVSCFEQNKWFMNNDLLSGWGLNKGYIGHESSALTTKPEVLALKSNSQLNFI